MFSLLFCSVKEIRKKSWFSHAYGIQKIACLTLTNVHSVKVFACREKRHDLPLSADFFSDLTFSKISFRNTIRVSNSLDLTKLQPYSGPELRVRN